MTKYENLECFRKLTGEQRNEFSVINEAYHQGAIKIIHFW